MQRKNANELNELAREEIKNCVKGQENGKAAGSDDIYNET